MVKIKTTREQLALSRINFTWFIYMLTKTAIYLVVKMSNAQSAYICKPYGSTVNTNPNTNKCIELARLAQDRLWPHADC